MKFLKRIAIVLVNINVKKNVYNVILVNVNNADMVMFYKCLNVYQNVEIIRLKNKNNVMMGIWSDLMDAIIVIMNVKIHVYFVNLDNA